MLRLISSPSSRTFIVPLPHATHWIFGFKALVNIRVWSANLLTLWHTASSMHAFTIWPRRNQDETYDMYGGNLLRRAGRSSLARVGVKSGIDGRKTDPLTLLQESCSRCSGNARRKIRLHPTPENMTFGKSIAHIAEVNNFACSNVSDMPAPKHQAQ